MPRQYRRDFARGNPDYMEIAASRALPRRPALFLTIINDASTIFVRLNSYTKQEDAMAAESKSGKVRSTARSCAVKQPGRPGRAARSPEAWEQTALVPDQRYDEIDCQRIVQGDGGRSLPVYYDDYN